MGGSQAPNVLVIGAARSGTTALARTLDAHPDVFVSTPKETHFFAHRDNPVHYVGPGDDVMINRSLVSDPAQFLKLFQTADTPIRVEGSVSTLYFPDRSIPSIQATCPPDVKLAVMLRSPAERAHSAYLYLRGRGHETVASFESALAIERERIDAGWHHMWHYAAMSQYEQQLARFVDVFGDSLHVIVLEEFKADGDRVLGQLCDFLDIDPAGVSSPTNEVNRGGEPRFGAVARAINLARSQPLVARVAKRLVNPERRDQIRAKNLQQPGLDPQLARRLEAEFEPAIAYVEGLLGRRIESWHV